jgi:hypothetical protein
LIRFSAFAADAGVSLLFISPLLMLATTAAAVDAILRHACFQLPPLPMPLSLSLPFSLLFSLHCHTSLPPLMPLMLAAVSLFLHFDGFR